MLQYMDRYRYLLQFSMDIAGTERLQIYYFVRGVEEVIASAIVSSGASTLQAMFERALTYETFLLQKNGIPVTASAGIERGQGSRPDGRSKRQCEESDRDSRSDHQDSRPRYEDRQWDRRTTER
ncbi:hypothetical protein Sjap_026466 [Stephania japonica]|uniref:Uncharacterized protein n=1 Tax=Stephania japonica TaxID=461633 RepID=A0AAP0HKG9_9MAGN